MRKYSANEWWSAGHTDTSLPKTAPYSLSQHDVCKAADNYETEGVRDEGKQGEKGKQKEMDILKKGFRDEQKSDRTKERRDENPK